MRMASDLFAHHKRAVDDSAEDLRRKYLEALKTKAVRRLRPSPTLTFPYPTPHPHRRNLALAMNVRCNFLQSSISFDQIECSADANREAAHLNPEFGGTLVPGPSTPASQHGAITSRGGRRLPGYDSAARACSEHGPTAK